MESGKYLRLIASVLFTALFLWLGAGLLPHAETLRTVTAESAELSDEILLAGYIVREEAPVYADGDYLPLAREGQWLPCGAALAVSRSEAAQYFSYSDTAKPASSLGIEELFCALSLSKNGEERRRLTRSAEEYLFGTETENTESVSMPQSVIFSEKSGYFCRYCDGYEGLSTDDAFGEKAAVPENCIGKTVSGDCWFFVAEVEVETAERLSVGDSVTLGGYPASVEKITDGTVVFRLRRGLEAHLSDRFLSLTLTLCRYEGISLPREAVISENGESYIRILHLDGEEQLWVDIIYDGGKSCIVRGEGLAEGMQIILP